MPQINDVIVAALSKEGFGNQIETAQVNWLQSQGAISTDLNTAWAEY